MAATEPSPSSVLVQHPERDPTFALLDADGVIRRVCLSFALFKLLRRRFEHLLELTEEEARDCRRVFLMRSLHPREDAAQLFQVVADEMKFLSEYYHSVVPVVLASPWFVLANYFLLPVAVLGLCLIAILVIGKGDVSYVLSRMSADNYALRPGFAGLAVCSVARAAESRPAFFFVLDLSITLLLLIVFFLEEIWEFLVVLNSNWFVVSMLCNYATRRRWHESPAISGAFRRILWLRRKMSRYTNNIRLKQFSLLGHRGSPFMVPSLELGSVPATVRLKRSIMNYLVRLLEVQQADPHGRHGPTNGRSALCRNWRYDLDDLCWACDSDSVAEVILTWHVATCTCLVDASWRELEEEDDGGGSSDHREVAMSLSRYCAYLVAFQPELLPDRRAKSELVLEAAIKELRAHLGFVVYYMASNAARIRWLTTTKVDRIHGSRVVLNGLKLWRQLREMEVVWEVLDDVWTELMVYAAPASDERHVNAHAEILPEGVELITVLWAITMHTGISRPPRPPASN